MAEFLQTLDPSKLVLVETALSFIISPFATPPYNLAIFLFGTYAQENTESLQPLKTFTGMLGVSVIFDIIWMFQNEQNGFVKLITILIVLLKLPTFFAFGTSLRQRGAQFGGLGIHSHDFSGATVWSVPGGFTSGGRDGYQTVDEESRAQPPPKAASPSPAAHPTAGAYQSV